ncbi:SPOR domain-containing protein [Candidatus Litorirhabdus singularis]|uniref:SPOR domain-containing protein n=1 Tax=Candidatus Litorirhabdus singularis TaxID=2518993 RepID=UPI00242BEC7D|nr:SPOR domain-containing protein [Candidatus Litorirhabdus singularis]
MNDVLKQRLVGALVIIVLGVIFWPVIFVTPELEPVDRSSQVPAIPALARRDLPAPKPLQGLPKARYSEEVAVSVKPAAPKEKPAVVGKPIDKPKTTVKPARVDKPVAKPAEKASPSLDAEGIPVAWTLQVVTVGSQEKAEKLTVRLIGMGYKAYIKSLRRDSGTLYRVYVGPKFAQADMLEAKQVIDRELRVTSMITRYLP